MKWALGASQLLVATEVRNLTDFQKAVLLNEEIIAVSQDPLGKAGGRVRAYDCGEGLDATCQQWVRPLRDGTHAVVLYNSGAVAHNVTLDLAAVVPGAKRGDVRCLWCHKDLGTFESGAQFETRPHAVWMFKVALLQ